MLPETSHCSTSGFVSLTAPKNLIDDEEITKVLDRLEDSFFHSRRMLRVPFGMKNSGATLVRGMRQLLSDMNTVDNYIDDLIVYTKYWESHLATL